MTQIGNPIKTIVIEPIKVPVPKKPVKVPEKEPVPSGS